MKAYCQKGECRLDNDINIFYLSIIIRISKSFINRTKKKKEYIKLQQYDSHQVMPLSLKVLNLNTLWLRSLAVITEDLRLIPIFYAQQLPTICNHSFRVSEVLLASVGPETHEAYA